MEGMQKEAIVHYGPTGTVWRMVSDEGPYLNGTDLAPFPLAFYTAGMAFSFMTELLRHARVHEVEIRFLRKPERVVDANDSYLLAVWSDQPDLWDADAVIDTRLGADGASLVRSIFSWAQARGTVPSNDESPGADLRTGPASDRSARQLLPPVLGPERVPQRRG